MIKTFKDILQESELTEAKKGYELNFQIDLLKVGLDNNGNYSYWVDTPKGKKKIQHDPTTMGSKITKDDLKKFDPKKHKKTIDGLMKYYNKFIKK